MAVALISSIVLVSGITPAHAVSVTVPITINMRTGSDTPETAGTSFTVTCTGGGGTHDGNSATQNFTCDNDVTVTVAAPAATGTSRFTFSDGSTSKTFTSCSSGTCSTTTYSDVTRQVKINATLTGKYLTTVSGKHLGTTVVQPISNTTDAFLKFNNTSGYVDLGTGSSLNFTSSFSISAWAKFDATTMSGADACVVCDYDGTNKSYIFGYRSFSGEKGFSIYVYNGGTLVSSYATDLNPSLNTWYHVVVTYNPSTSIRTYVNGVLESEATSLIPASIDATSISPKIGIVSGLSQFPGDIDDVRIYNKVLSTTEVARLYAGVSVSDSSLKGWYKLNENTGTSAADSSGNSNTGTLTSSPTWATHAWVDQRTNIEITNPAYVVPDGQTESSATERWLTDDRYTYNVTAASAYSLDYVKQWENTFTLSGLDQKQAIGITKTHHATSGIEKVSGTTDSYTFYSGSAQYATVTTTGTSRNDGTIAVWVSPDFDLNNVESAAIYGIFYEGTSTSNDLILSVANNSGTGNVPAVFFVSQGGVGTSWENLSKPLSELTWQSNEWHHVAATWATNATHTNVKLYIDGSLVDSAAQDKNTASARPTSTIGRALSSDDWEGGIDNVKRYSSALTAAQIDQLYDGVHISTGLVLDIRFEEGSGSSSTDYSGQSNTATLTGSPSWRAGVWADDATMVTVPKELVLTTDQERFKSYSATNTFSTTAGGGTNTVTYQHEFYQLFRITEEHSGVIFAPMPSVSFTASITTANSTVISSQTFDTQNTDDYVELDTRYWIKNGTQTFGGVTWRGLTVLPTGQTCAVTSYGNCDVEVYSKHVGYGPPYHHFRIGTDGLTTDISAITFNDDAATLAFTSTASGTKDTIVEFLGTDYGAVSRVTLDGTDISSSTWAVTVIDSTTSILTINDVAMSEHTFVIYFAAAGSGGSAGGGGGGGGGISVPPVIPPTSGSAVHLKVTIQQYFVGAGQTSQPQDIIIEWQGATKIVIQSIVFTEEPGWFMLGTSLPTAAYLQDGSNILRTTIPMTVSVPEGTTDLKRIIPVRVTVASGSGSEYVDTSVEIFMAGSGSSLPVYIGIGIIAVAAGAVAWRARKR